MKKTMVYGAAVLALAAAPVFAQTGTTAGQTSTPGQTGSMPTARPGGGSESMRASSPDHMFVMEAAQGGMAEVALGQLASEKASNDRVKQFGQRMVADHGKANGELKALAQTKGISIPADVGAKHKATQDRLSKLSGAAFDRAYIQEMVADHQKDVADFRKESQGGSDNEVKAWAAKTLPTLEEHYKMVQDLNSSMSTGSMGTSGTGSNTGGSISGTGAGSGTPGTTGRPGTVGTPGTPGTGSTNGASNPR